MAIIAIQLCRAGGETVAPAGLSYLKGVRRPEQRERTGLKLDDKSELEDREGVVEGRPAGKGRIIFSLKHRKD